MLNLLRKIIPSVILLAVRPLYHKFLAFLGALIYRFPSKEIIVIGITGTKGKSTTVELISKILQEAGYKVGSSSSIQFRIGDRAWLNTIKMTMPGRFKIQKLLREAVDHGCKYFVLEVTSEGIIQSRHLFIDFDIVALTNIHPEHIEAHKSFENYKKAKGELFKAINNSARKNIDNKIINKTAFINADDKESDYFLSLVRVSKITYSLKEVEYALSVNRSRLVFDNTIINIKLLGKFNIYNALLSIKICLALGINLTIIKEALEKVAIIAGRMEEVKINQDFKVFVDYAHTPESLESVYEFLSGQSKNLICVLGSAGGGRDKFKRPLLGKIAAKYCRDIIITNEDPYDEDPYAIIQDVARGVNSKILPKLIIDRREAISAALDLAKKNDVVIITGKGCEPWMMLSNGKKISWDDRKVVAEELQKNFLLTGLTDKNCG